MSESTVPTSRRGSTDLAQTGRRLANEAAKLLEQLDANTLTFEDLIRMFEVGQKLERLACGLPTDIIEVRGAFEDADMMLGTVLVQLRYRIS